MNNNEKLIGSRYKPASTKLLGGMSEAMIYEDQILKRKVVIKTIKNILDIGRILDEINALQRIRSKHVIEIYDVIRDDPKKKILIVEEYLPGSDLFVYTKNDFDSDQYIRVLYQIIAGIKDIHEKNIIHRDIKPNNIKFDGEKYLKIFDFGLARTEGNDNSTIGFKGTRGFAAPELYSNKRVLFTKTIDVFAFGVTAWVIGKNKLPEDLTNPLKIKDNIIDFRSTKISLPEEIAIMLNKTLNINPENRPSSQVLFELFSRYLLFKKHRANIFYDGNVKEINQKNSTVELTSELGRIKIIYNGLYFLTEEVVGEIFINNQQAFNNQHLPGACVITFGNPERGASRNHVAFELAHPEVVL